MDDRTMLMEELQTVRDIIKALQNKLLEAGVESSIYSQATVDDGQTKVMSTYRSPREIALSIFQYKRMENDILARLNGRGIRVISGRSGL